MCFCVSLKLGKSLAGGGNENKQQPAEEEVEGGDGIVKELKERIKKWKRHPGSGSTEKLGDTGESCESITETKLIWVETTGKGKKQGRCADSRGKNVC